MLLSRWIHGCLAGIPGTFGLILFKPGDTFPTSRNYRLFARIASEDQWGVALLAACVVGLAGLCVRDRVWRTYSLVFLGTVHWGVALLFTLSNPQSAASATYAWVAIMAWLVAWDSRRGTV